MAKNKGAQRRAHQQAQPGSLSSPLEEGTSDAILGLGENGQSAEGSEQTDSGSGTEEQGSPSTSEPPVDPNSDTPLTEEQSGSDTESQADPLDPTVDNPPSGEAVIEQTGNSEQTDTSGGDPAPQETVSSLMTKAAAARIGKAGERGTVLVQTAEARKAQGVQGALTVNSASDALREHIFDTAVMTLKQFKDPKTKEMRTVTVKVPGCEAVKGVRRKTKEGFTGDLTVIGHMVEFIENAGGSAQAEDVARHMEGLFLNFDRGYLRGSGKGKYGLWDIEGPSPDSRRGKGRKAA